MFKVFGAILSVTGISTLYTKLRESKYLKRSDEDNEIDTSDLNKTEDQFETYQVYKEYIQHFGEIYKVDKIIEYMNSIYENSVRREDITIIEDINIYYLETVIELLDHYSIHSSTYTEVENELVVDKISEVILLLEEKLKFISENRPIDDKLLGIIDQNKTLLKL